MSQKARRASYHPISAVARSGVGLLCRIETSTVPAQSKQFYKLICSYRRYRQVFRSGNFSTTSERALQARLTQQLPLLPLLPPKNNFFWHFT